MPTTTQASSNNSAPPLREVQDRMRDRPHNAPLFPRLVGKKLLKKVFDASNSSVMTTNHTPVAGLQDKQSATDDTSDVPTAEPVQHCGTDAAALLAMRNELNTQQTLLYKQWQSFNIQQELLDQYGMIQSSSCASTTPSHNVAPLVLTPCYPNLLASDTSQEVGNKIEQAKEQCHRHLSEYPLCQNRHADDSLYSALVRQDAADSARLLDLQQQLSERPLGLAGVFQRRPTDLKIPETEVTQLREGLGIQRSTLREIIRHCPGLSMDSEKSKAEARGMESFFSEMRDFRKEISLSIAAMPRTTTTHQPLHAALISHNEQGGYTPPVISGTICLSNTSAAAIVTLSALLFTGMSALLFRCYRTAKATPKRSPEEGEAEATVTTEMIQRSCRSP